MLWQLQQGNMINNSKLGECPPNILCPGKLIIINQGIIFCIWSGCLLGAFLWRFSGHVQLVGEPEADPEHAGGITYLIWPGNASGSPRRSWKTLLGRGTSGTLCLACCHRDPAPDKRNRVDGWMDGYFTIC